MQAGKKVMYFQNMEEGQGSFNESNSTNEFNETFLWELQEEEKQILANFGAWLVFMEMSVALVGIILNLTVVISIREKEALMNNTVNVILGNLCFANLVAAVFTKSIAVIYHGYAVARSRWEVELAFCTVHTVTSRATWAVFPYTLFVLCWHSLALRAGRIIHNCAVKKSMAVTADAAQGYMLGAIALPIEASVKADSTNGDEARKEEEEEDDEDMGEGLTAKQKSALGFIWFVSGIYSILSDQILSKERDVHCSLRSDLSEKFNYMSLIVAIAAPFIGGPLFCPLGHTILSLVACCKGVDGGGSCGDSKTKDAAGSGLGRTSLADCGVTIGFTLVFIIVYPVQMYVTEEYIANVQSMFVFMAFKYCYGSLHIVLIPFVILTFKRDIRQAAVATYIKTNVDDGEITFEQLQEHCGIGVQPN